MINSPENGKKKLMDDEAKLNQLEKEELGAEKAAPWLQGCDRPDPTCVRN